MRKQVIALACLAAAGCGRASSKAEPDTSAAVEVAGTSQATDAPSASEIAEPGRVLVYVAAPGYDAASVEGLITAPLESALRSLPGLNAMRSTSAEGEAHIELRGELGREEQLLRATRVALDEAMVRVPDDAERPVVQLVGLERDLYLVSREPAGPAALVQTLDQLRATRGVTSVEQCGGAPEQLRIAVDPEMLRAHAVDLHQMRAALASASVDGAALAPATDARHLAPRLGRVSLRADPPLTLRDVAELRVERGERCECGHPSPIAACFLVSVDPRRADERSLREALGLDPNDTDVDGLRGHRVQAQLRLVWSGGIGRRNAEDPGDVTWKVLGAGVDTSLGVPTGYWFRRAPGSFFGTASVDLSFDLSRVTPQALRGWAQMLASRFPGTQLVAPRWPDHQRARLRVMGPEAEPLSRVAIQLVDAIEASGYLLAAEPPPPPRPELIVEGAPDKLAAFGLTSRDLSQAVRVALMGEQVSIAGVDVQLDLRGEGPADIQGLLDLSLATAQGPVALGAVASVELATQAPAMQRFDGQRGFEIEFWLPRGPASERQKRLEQLRAEVQLPEGIRFVEPSRP